MQQLENWKLNARTWSVAITIAFAAVVITGARYIAVDSASTKLSSAESGLQTCFSRVTQAITALSLGDKGNAYTSKEFNKTTSECFADFKESIAAIGASVAINNAVNDLLGKAHWLTKEIPNAKPAQLDSLYTRYAQIEETVHRAWDEIDSHKQANHQSEHFWFQAFTWTSVFGFLLMAFNISTSIQREKQWHVGETQAQDSNNVEDVDAILENNQEEQFEFVAPELNSVSDMVNDIYESIDAKAKSSQTTIELNNNVDLPFKGDADVFGQLVHTAFCYAIDKATQSDENNIKATIKNLGNIVRADFLIEGQCFNSDELESTYSKSQKVSNINLTLLNEIAAENNVEVVLKNEFIPSGARAVLAVSFQDTVADVAANKKKIATIVKGTKKEILAAMN